MFLFENSLRRDTPPVTPKKHTSCKGTAHGSGNYGCVDDKPCVLDRSPFQRNNSKRWSGRSDKTNTSCVETESVKSVESNKSAFRRNGSARWSLKSTTNKPEKKSTSVSSENFSESDSLDSLGEKTKSIDHPEDAAGKDLNVSDRLYNGVTRSSIAKTAKMRHLDIFDVDDNIWIGGLRKSNVTDDPEKKMKQKNFNEIDNSFDRSLNGSFRKKNGNDHNIATKSKGTPPKVPPRNSWRRRSFKKAKQISYDEILYMSTNKKTPGFFNVVNSNDCYKDFKEISIKSDDQVGFGHVCTIENQNSINLNGYFWKNFRYLQPSFFQLLFSLCFFVF